VDKGAPHRWRAGPGANRIQNASEWNIWPGLLFRLLLLLPCTFFFFELPRWLKSNPTGLAGPEANRVHNASDWNVRPSLKYEWQTSERAGTGRSLSRSTSASYCGNWGALSWSWGLHCYEHDEFPCKPAAGQPKTKEESLKNVLFTPGVCNHWRRPACWSGGGRRAGPTTIARSPFFTSVATSSCWWSTPRTSTM